MVKLFLNYFERRYRRKTHRAIEEWRAETARTRRNAKPLTIQLVASNDATWLDAPMPQVLNKYLTSLGFTPIGIISLNGGKQPVASGYSHRDSHVRATIFIQGGECYLSFTSYFTDGSVLVCSNAPAPIELPYPEWLTHVRLTDESPKELWTEFNLKAANRERKSMSHRSLAEMEMEDFARCTAWFNERGGSTRGELAARLKAAGKLPDESGGDKYLDSAREIEADQSLCNWWRLQPDTPCPLEQILETLTIIHDEMTPETLLQSYWRASYDLGCTEVSLGTDTPRQAFARVVASRGDKLRKVREKATPLAADFYLLLT